MITKVADLIWENKALIIILITVFIIRFPSLLEPLYYQDEGIYLTMGQKILRGGILYQEIFDHKTPGIYYLAAASIKAFGASIWGFRFLLLLWMLITLPVFFFLSQKMFDRRTALIATIILALLTSTPFLEGNIVNSEILMILPTTLGIWFGLKGRYFLSGLLFSMAVLLKFPAIFDFAAMFIFFTLTSKRTDLKEGMKKLIIFTSGLVIPILITVIYFAFKGALADYFNSAFIYNLSYTSYGNKFIIPNGLLIVKALPLVTLVGYFGLRLYQRFRKGGKYEFSHFEFLVVWLAFAYYAATFGGRPYEHYLIQALPPFAILVALAITVKKYRLAGVVIFIIAIVLTGLLKFSPTIKPDYYPNFFKFIFNQITFDEYANGFNPRAARNYAIASYLRGCDKYRTEGVCETPRTSEGEKIYVFANEPMIYFLSGLDPAAPYLVFFHISGNDRAKAQTAKLLKQAKPKFILVEQPPPGKFSELEVILSTSYNHFARYENITIYRYQEKSSLPALF